MAVDVRESLKGRVPSNPPPQSSRNYIEEEGERLQREWRTPAEMKIVMMKGKGSLLL